MEETYFHKVVNGYHFRFIYISNIYQYYRFYNYADDKEIQLQSSIKNQVTVSTYSCICKEPEELIIPDKVEYDGVIYNVTAIDDLSSFKYVKKIYIPKSIIMIRYLNNNENLEQIEFEKDSGLKYIHSFSECLGGNIKLKKIWFPDSLKIFNIKDILYCKSLEYFRVSEDCTFFNNEDRLLYDDVGDNIPKTCPNLKYIVWGSHLIKQTILNKNRRYYKII